MDSEMLFYVAGIVLAVSAVVASFLGLRVEKFPGRAAPLVVIWFIALIGATTTSAVIHAQHEKEHDEHALEQAGEEAEEVENEGTEAAP